ncbi:MAG: flagellar biosynthetic protein FliO [Myxococcota bacterium]
MLYSGGLGVVLQGAFGGYGASLVQALLALLAVSILAFVVLRWAQKRGAGLGGFSGRRVEVLERVILERGRSLYLIRIGEKVLLLGAGEGAAPQVLAELSPDELPELPDESGHGFSDLLRRLGKPGG